MDKINDTALTAVLHLKVTDDMSEAIRNLAFQQRISQAEWVRQALTIALVQKGAKISADAG